MYQVNRRNLMDITDVLALVLGMQAGFSFISRIMKYLLERCNWMNYSEEESCNLINDLHHENNNDERKEEENEDNSIELSSNFRS